VLETASGFR